MIIINYDSIEMLGLPLNSTEMVRQKDETYKKAKKKVRRFEKKYAYKSNTVCPTWGPKYYNVGYNHIPQKDREEWFEAFKTVVSASRIYRFYIWFFRIMMLDTEV